ncbi:MAG: copper homeostasis protein CutC [Gemmatimonadetes bacterium]|nr:copper homeostasis protein CutC [Gemmatimonadota bacterium]
MHVLVEAAVESVAGAVAAGRAGAGRLELCAGLAEGGVTPSAGLVRAVRRRVELPLQVLLRPRPGDFRYDDGDVDAMLTDLHDLKLAGADGVVIGALSTEGGVDRDLVARLVARARPLAVSFHRAIDQVPDLGAAVATLAELGIGRVLTSGGAPTALAGADTLRRLVQRFGATVTILAGGGVRADHVARLVQLTGVREIHLGPRLPDGAGLDVAELEGVIRALTTPETRT